MDEFPNNTDEALIANMDSKPAIAEQEQPVGVHKRNPTFGDKVKRKTEGVWSYIFKDILIPAFKNTLVSMVQNGIAMLVNGNVDMRRRDYRDDRIIRTPYSSYSNSGYYDQNYGGRGYIQERRPVPTYLYDELEFDEIGRPERILATLRNEIFRRGAVSIAFYYRQAGYMSDHTAENWGWINLDSARIIRTNTGYVLRLPKPVEIEL